MFNHNVPIFTITTVRQLTIVGGMRSVGYAHKYGEAAIMVMNNDCDISENGYYTYAVIEETMPGVYTYPRKEYWWKWNKEERKYFACEKPEKFKQTAGFGLG